MVSDACRNNDELILTYLEGLHLVGLVKRIKLAHWKASEEVGLPIEPVKGLLSNISILSQNFSITNIESSLFLYN